MGFVKLGVTAFFNCGVIIDALDRRFWQQESGKRIDIEPFVRRSFDSPIVEVKTIHVNVSFHGETGRNSRGRPRAASHPAPERDRGVIDTIIAELGVVVNRQNGLSPGR